jgi:hypothetical protein
MKTKLIITALFIIMTYGCTDLCRLTRDDKDWLLVDCKSLNYLENDNKTIKVDISNKVSNAWGSEGWWPTGEGYEVGESIIYLRDSLYMISIVSSACKNNGSIFLFHKKYSEQVLRLPYYKDFILNNTVTILGKEYKNCFVYKDSTYFKNLTYVKSYGIVKIEFRDGYKLELIP